jgi:MtN3 and saliva related transmembrane protein
MINFDLRSKKNKNLKKNQIMENYVTFIGFFSGFCTTIAFIPQAYKVWKTKSTKDISLWMFLIFTAGVAGWLVYGVLTDNLPIIFANIVTLFLAFLILLAKIKFN